MFKNPWFLSGRSVSCPGVNDAQKCPKLKKNRLQLAVVWAQIVNFILALCRNDLILNELGWRANEFWSVERKDSFGLESDWLNWFQFSHKPCLVHDFSRRNNYQNIISETNASSWSLSHSDSSVKHEVKNVSFRKKISRLGPSTFIALEPFTFCFRTIHI